MSTESTFIDGNSALNWVNHFDAVFREAQESLTELDRLAGDGDFGTNIASALRRANDRLDQLDGTSFATVFGAVSQGFLATGGTSGPLFGMWLRDIARCASPRGAEATQLAAGVSAGLSTIKQLGGAKVGDNTMIDALEPASQALTAVSASGGSLREALTAAAKKARTGALSTNELIAARGRASYVGALAQGVLDPGAVTIALFFEAGATVFGADEQWPSLVSTRSTPIT